MQTFQITEKERIELVTQFERSTRAKCLRMHDIDEIFLEHVLYLQELSSNTMRDFFVAYEDIKTDIEDLKTKENN